MEGGTATFSATFKTATALGFGQTLTATDTKSSSIAGSSPVPVNSAGPDRLILSAPGSATEGAPFTITVTVLDVFGNKVTDYSGTIHFTSQDSRSGLPAASTFGASAHVQDTSDGVTLGT